MVAHFEQGLCKHPSPPRVMVLALYFAASWATQPCPWPRTSDVLSDSIVKVSLDSALCFEILNLEKDTRASSAFLLLPARFSSMRAP